MKPSEIEPKSFQIIDEEAGEHSFPADEWSVVRRMIHTTADFEFIKTVRFHPQAIEAGVKAICEGKNIITDTEMARVGIRKVDMDKFGVKVSCLVNDAEVNKYAAEKNITRTSAAVEAAIPLMEGGIYAIGNAPTALLRLIELIKEGKAKPALVIGLPVGFVNAAESKELLVKMDYPHISNIGRKGGSNLAACVVNALGRLALNED